MQISAKLSNILTELKANSISSDRVNLINRLFAKTEKLNYLDYKLSPDTADGFIFTALPSNVTVDSGRQGYSSESRQKITLGKLLNSVAPDFSENAKRQLIEAMIVKIKTSIGEYKLEVVSGEDIRWAYHPDHYAPGGSGCNINSCMAHSMYQLNIDFYVYNPETIRMLRALTDKKKVAGRALIYTAYRTIEDLMEGRNARVLLGRYYIATTSIQALFDDWAQSNVDFKIQSQTVYGFNGEEHNNWTWYIPLKHWDLNYYPYMDHFPYLYKNLVDGYGIWTTDSTYSKTHKWIQPGKDSYKDSEGNYNAKEDPFRPGKVFLVDKKQWVDQGDLVKIAGIWVEKKDTEPCQLCEELTLKHNVLLLYDGRKVCPNHKTTPLMTGKYALLEETAKCEQCCYSHLKTEIKDKVCDLCRNKMKECPKCGQSVDKNFYFTIFDGTEICANCADTGNYKRCDDCFLIRQNVIQYKEKQNQWLCVFCYTPPVKESELPFTVDSTKSSTSTFDVAPMTNENYVSDSIDLEISPTAMRIRIQPALAEE